MGIIGNTALYAQTQADPKLGNWLIATLQKTGSLQQPWGGFAETQIRMNAVLGQFQYYEYKGGISRDIGPNFTGLLGVGRYVTYDYRDLDLGPQTREWRIWEQLTINQLLYRLKFEHRYRVEQRWITPLGYRNRFRYRLNLSIPLNKHTVGSRTSFVSVYNEIFLNNKAPHFERNRCYVGLGYQLSHQLILQTGWLYQYDFNNIQPKSKSNWVIACTVRLPDKTKTEKIPSHIGL